MSTSVTLSDPEMWDARGQNLRRISIITLVGYGLTQNDRIRYGNKGGAYRVHIHEYAHWSTSVAINQYHYWSASKHHSVVSRYANDQLIGRDRRRQLEDIRLPAATEIS